MMTDSSMDIAIGLLMIGGVIDGSLGLFLKYPKHWRWEHLWLTYVFLAFVAIPWLLASATVKNLVATLKLADLTNIGQVFVFGLAWGCGAVLYGLALKYAGMALTYAIVMGLTAAIGSFAPLVIFHPSELATSRGQLISLAVIMVVSGVVLCALAAHMKESALAGTTILPSVGRRPMYGIGLAVLSGLFSPMINLSFAYGAPLTSLAVHSGTNPWLASNIVWAIALSAGGLVNMVYCSLVISSNRSWGTLFQRSSDWLLGILMGCLGPISLILYGMGNSQLGELGPVISWPIMSSLGILGANLWGAVTGEWKGSGRKPLLFVCSAAVLLIAAMCILGYVEKIRQTDLA